MIDIYNRLPTDTTYKFQIETEDEVEQLLSQIKMILGTANGDVLGDFYFGVNVKKFLFSFGYNKQELIDILKTAVLTNISYDTAKYSVNFSVDFGHDTTNASDYAVINVTINDIKYMGVMITQ